MFDRVIGFSTLGGFTLSLLLFLSRMFYLVTPSSPYYYPVNWTFLWVFGAAIILGDVFVVRKLYLSISSQKQSSRWLLSAGAFFGLLIWGGVVWLTLCVGMNFMGQ